MRREILAALFLAASLSPAARAETAPAPAETAAALPAITVVRVRAVALTDRVIASGTIGAVEEVAVQPEIEGVATSDLRVEVGAWVAAGEVLATLSDSTLKLQKSQLEAQLASADAAIAQAEAQIAEAEATAGEAVRVRDRTVALRRQGTFTEAQADQATAQATAALARLNSARQGLASAQAQRRLVEAQIADMDLKLARTAVKAPVAGQVSARNAMVGAIASMASTPMFMLIRDGALELRAELPEADLLRVRAGQAATLSVAGLDRPIAATVRLVEPTVNTQTRLGHVRLSIADPSAVRSGMFASAAIVVAERTGLALPVASIGLDRTGPVVMRVTGDRVAATPVVTGIRDGEHVEIVKGLAEGDAVVARAGAFVRDGDRIRPVERDDAGTVSN